MKRPNQGPLNLYGRGGKFHPTFKSRIEKHRFSIPLLTTWCHQTAPICTYIFKISGSDTTGPHKWAFHPQNAQTRTYIYTNFPETILPDLVTGTGAGPFPDPSTSACIHHPTFSELTWPLGWRHQEAGGMGMGIPSDLTRGLAASHKLPQQRQSSDWKQVLVNFELETAHQVTRNSVSIKLSRLWSNIMKF